MAEENCNTKRVYIVYQNGTITKCVHYKTGILQNGFITKQVYRKMCSLKKGLL